LVNKPTAAPGNETPSVIGVAPDQARAFLLTLAQSLQGTVMPELQGHAKSIAGECAEIATRLAQQLCPDPQARAILNGIDDAAKRDAVGREGDALDAMNDETRALLEAKHEQKKRLKLDKVRFETYLKQHPLGGATTRVLDATMLSGGRSKSTILVKLTGASSLPDELIVRYGGAGAEQEFTNELVRPLSVEFEIMQFAQANGIKTPRPLLLEKSADVMGGPFMAIEYCAGRPAGDMFRPLRSERYALDMAAQLGLLHSLSVDSLKATVPVRSCTQEKLRAELKGYRDVVAMCDTPSYAVKIALDWMEKNIPAVEGPLGLVHADVGFNNTMAEDGELVAILDWELAHLGNSAKDLGFFRSDIELVIPWPQFMAAYHAAGGPRYSEVTINFYTLWSNMWLYTIVQQTRAGLAAGMVNDIELVHYCSHFGPVITQRLTHQLDAILAKK
jgi:aminoglycoside phosphotransferase (APT) family kinase protein